MFSRKQNTTKGVVGLLTIFASLFNVGAARFPKSRPAVQSIPPEAFNGSVTPSFTSEKFGFDGPRMSDYNSTVWDWWYFDVVEPGTNSSIIVIFNLALDTALLGGSKTIMPNADITGTFPNGTRYAYHYEASDGAVVITEKKGGSSGVWHGTGMKWSSSPDMKTYVVSIETPAISGTITYHSLAPPHYPCGPKVPGSKLEIARNFGWANAVPDADVDVDLMVRGEGFRYNGVGYHDKVRFGDLFEF